jgi:hypothetical protein
LNINGNYLGANYKRLFLSISNNNISNYLEYRVPFEYSGWKNSPRLLGDIMKIKNPVHSWKIDWPTSALLFLVYNPESNSYLNFNLSILNNLFINKL